MISQAAAEQASDVPPKAPKALLGSAAVPADIFAPLTDGRPGNVWFTSDYLMWWTKASPAPPLAIYGPPPSLTTNGPTTQPIPTSAFIGLYTSTSTYSLGINNATGTAFGNDIRDPLSNGGRFTLGGWLDSDQSIGLEGRYLFLLRSWGTFAAGPSNGVLAIPYQNAVTGAQTSYPINLPQSATSSSSVFVNTTPAVFVHLYDTGSVDTFAGNLNIRSTSALQGGEANAVWNIARASNWQLEAIAGFRFLELDETLTIESSVGQIHTDTTTFEPSLGLPTGAIPVVNHFTSVVNRLDNYETHNSFYGGQLGLRGEYQWGRLSISVGGQVGLGVMNEFVSIDGATNTNMVLTQTPTKKVLLAGIPLTVASGAANQTTAYTNTTRGGLFAQPTNIGRYSRNAFEVVPEGMLKLNYRFTDRVTGSIGYTFLYMSSVVHPGDQITTAINPTQLASPPANTLPPQPIYQMRTADYWAQGLNFGVELRY